MNRYWTRYFLSIISLNFPNKTVGWVLLFWRNWGCLRKNKKAGEWQSHNLNLISLTLNLMLLTASVTCSVMSDSLWSHGLLPPGFSAHGTFQVTILEWVAIFFSREPRDWTQVSSIAGGFFTSWATRELTLWNYCLQCNQRRLHFSPQLYRDHRECLIIPFCRLAWTELYC